MSKEMVIYWYTTTCVFNDIEPGVSYCIGEADPNANEYFGMNIRNIADTRIKQELGRSSKDGTHIKFNQITDINCRLVDFPNPKNKIKSLDKDVHAVLKEIGCRQIGTEWFNTSSEEIQRVLDYIENGTPLGKPYTLWKRQPDAIAKFKDAFFNGQDKFGLFAMPRFGKTICSFEMMNFLFEQYPNKKYVFFISAKLDAEQAIREDYYKHQPSCNFRLYVHGSELKPTPEALTNNKWCFFASKQWFDGKYLEDIQKEFPIVNRDDCIAVFFDEAHFARMTERAQRTLKILNPNMTIDITGTPFRLKSNEDYNDDNSYVYSVLDEADDYEKAQDKEKFRLENPEMVYITPDNIFFNTDSKFSDFFDSDKATEYIQNWVKKSFYGDGFHMDGKKLDITNAIVVVPPRKRYCDLFYKAVTDIAKKEKLAIKCVRTSTKDDSNEDYDPNTKEVFSNWNMVCKNDKDNFHLLVTIGKGLQSVSFPDCHAVIMMCDMTSPEQYVQAAFRSKTPNDHKKEAYVIDYCKGRTLQVIDTMIRNHLYVSACDSHYKAEYERALSTIKICDGNLTRQDYTFEEIFQTFVQNWHIDRITDRIDFDFNKLLAKIDLSKVDVKDLLKPHQLSLTLTDRGDGYEETADPNPDLQPEPEQPDDPNPDWKQKYIEDLKTKLITYGYIPFGGDETTRIKDINPDKIEIRELEIGAEKEKRKVWSYMGGDGDLDDIYIDDSFDIPELIRWRYCINNKFVNIKGEGDHGSGNTDIKKARAFVNAIIRYLPAYFFVTDKINSFEELRDRFGRQTVAEKFEERQFFRKFMGFGVDYRYLLEVLKACDIASREQILSFINMQIDKCYDSNKKIIPEKVCEFLLVYKKDGSHPVPQELAQKMRNGKNYDLAVCGGYWLTDDTTQMYITDSFSEAEIMKKLRPNCRVIYSTDILQTIEKEKENIMKFKSFIMNPPYGNLHLPILKRMIELVVENGGTGVSLQPVRWLQDPLWKYKSNTDAKRYKEYFENKIDTINIIKADLASKLFGSATFSMDLGIFNICKEGKLDYENFSYNSVIEKVLKNMPDYIENYVHQQYKKDFSVPTLPLYGHGLKGTGWIKNIIIEHGLYNGKDYLTYKKGNFKDTEKVANVVSFKTKQEAQNYIAASRTKFMLYLFIILQKDVNTPLKFYPFMNDYTQPWTDERFYQYFGITPEEKKIIEKTVANAKK